MKKKKILVVGQNIDTTALETDKVLLNVTLDNSHYIAEMTIPNFRTLIASGIALIEKIAANESTIALFATASGGYTFQQGDLISLLGNNQIYMYVGGTKTDVSNYSVMDVIKPTTREIYVDINRTDSYTENGTYLYPYKTILGAITWIKADYIAAADKQTTCYTVKLMTGVYSENISLNTVKYIRFEGVGVTLSGTIGITQSPIGGSGQEPYTRVEFVGTQGYRAEKGNPFTISGKITLERTNDSLSYVTFKGCRVTGAIEATVNGTWVLSVVNSRLEGAISESFSGAGIPVILLESSEFSEIVSTLTGKIDIYNSVNTDFYGVINITPQFECRFKNCAFPGAAAISIIAAKNLYADNVSLAALFNKGATLTGMTVVGLEAFSMTTVERNALVSVPKGTIIYNETTTFMELWNGATWIELLDYQTKAEADLLYAPISVVNNTTYASNAEVLAKTVNNKAVSPATIDGGVKRYKALISQSMTPKIGGVLTVGKNYLISVNTTGDFTNVGAANNNVGTQFIATGTTPTAWGDGELVETPEPTAIVLENTLGEVPTYGYSDVGVFNINVVQNLFTAKTSISFGASSLIDGTVYNALKQSQNQISISSTAAGVSYDAAFFETLIEIEVYP